MFVVNYKQLTPGDTKAFKQKVNCKLLAVKRRYIYISGVKANI